MVNSKKIPNFGFASNNHMNDNTAKAFGNIRIPQELVEDLKVWRQAFINVDNRPMTYECLINNMIELMKGSYPSVYAETTRIKSLSEQQ